MGAYPLKRGWRRAIPRLGITSRWLLPGLLLVLAVLVLLPAAPAINQTPNNDAAIFLYMGRQIADGQLPYRDAYDHKPPLIFYLNALGLLLSGGSRWGVWAVQVISLTSAAALAYALLARYFGRLAAVLAVSALLLNLAFVHDRGNLTEEYALPLQLAALWLLSQTERADRRGKFDLSVGLMLGLAALLKQPLAGIGLSVALYLFLKVWNANAVSASLKALLRRYALIAVGALLPWIAFSVYFAANGIFADYWEGTFTANFSYSDISTPERVQSMQTALPWLWSLSGFFVVGLLAWLTVLPNLFLHDRRVRDALSARWMGLLPALGGLALLYNGLFRAGVQMYALSELSAYRIGLIAAGGVLLIASLPFFLGPVRRLAHGWGAQVQIGEQSPHLLPLVVALVDLPVSFVLATMPGRNYAHYFMALLPALTILSAYAVHAFVQLLHSPEQRRMGWVWLTVLLLPVLIPGVWQTADTFTPRRDRQIEATAAYLREHTRPDQPVLQWGINAAVYILAERDSATRYFTANPLFWGGYSDEWQTRRLLADLQAHPPALIVDPLMARLPLVTAPDWQNCAVVQDPAYYRAFVDARNKNGAAVPPMTPGMGDVYQWICEHYTPDSTVGELGWLVYRWKGN